MSNIKHITPDELITLISTEDVVLLDIREKQCVSTNIERIKSAIHVPLCEINKKGSKLLEHSNRKIIVYSSHGRKSLIAAEQLSKAGIFSEVTNLEGGLENWKKAGKEIIKDKGLWLSIDRQMRLVLGTFILFALVMFYNSTINWLIIPLIISLGLINSAVTGWCGMTIFLATMPWNRAKY
jgi:rhodanese-related sulfurtransferase